MKKYIKENDNANFRVIKLKMEFTRLIPHLNKEIKKSKSLSKYLQTFIRMNMNCDIIGSDTYGTSEKYDKSFHRIMENIVNDFKYSFILNISKFHQKDDLWYRYILDFFNNFLNNELKSKNSRITVDAVFFKFSDYFLISVILNENVENDILVKENHIEVIESNINY